jgi:hypothetical protein
MVYPAFKGIEHTTVSSNAGFRRSPVKRTVLAALISAFAMSASPGLAAITTVEGFGTTPESCVFGPDGTVYVSITNAYDTYGDGLIGKVVDGKVEPVATGLNDPHGLDFWNGMLFTADNRGQIWKVELDGKVTKLADTGMFPRKVTNFNDIEIDPANGDIYVSDSGDWEGRGGAVFKITQDGKVSAVLTDDEEWKLVSPNGLKLDGKGGLLVYDWSTGVLLNVNLADKAVTRINGALGQGDGLAFTNDGGVLLGSYYQGVKLRGGGGASADGPMLSLEALGAKSVADIAVSNDGATLCVPDFDGSKLLILPVADIK